MALVVADRVKETTTTTGTGTITLAGASTGYQSFSAIGNGNQTYYTIAEQLGSDWEVGIGTYTSSGTTLSRDTVLSSSNSGSLVNFGAGIKDVFVTQPAERTAYVVGTTATFANSGIVPTSSGGTSGSSAQAGMNNLAGAVTSGYYLRGNGTNVVMAAISAGDVPTLNQNTTGYAAYLQSTTSIGGTHTFQAYEDNTNFVYGYKLRATGTTAPTLFFLDGATGNWLGGLSATSSAGLSSTASNGGYAQFTATKYITSSSASEILYGNTSNSTPTLNLYTSGTLNGYFSANSAGSMWMYNSRNATGVYLSSGNNGLQYFASSAYNIVLHAGNYYTYALPLSGGTVNGNLTVTSKIYAGGATVNSGYNGVFASSMVGAASGNKLIYLYNDGSTIKLDAYDYGVGGALSFSIGGNGGSVNVAGTLTQNGNTVLTSANYSSYALPLSGGNLSGAIGRSAAGAGYLSGNYNSVETTLTSGAIYSIGGSYVPGTTNLGNMYGVGYAYSGYAPANPGGVPTNRWIFYGATAGTAQWALDADQGNGYFNGGLVVNSRAVSSGSGGLRSVMPGGGIYTTTASSISGAIQITLPTTNYPMIRFTVKVYTYDSQSFEISCGGHTSGGTWYNTFAYMEGSQNRGALNVRFTYGGGYTYVYIGDLGSSWSYPQVFITDVQVGYTTYSVDSWDDGWVIGFNASTYNNISATWTVAPSLSTVGGTMTGTLNLSGDNYARFGPNSTWNAYLRVGGNGRVSTTDATVATTNGNLHLDSSNGNNIYLNYYAGGTVYGPSGVTMLSSSNYSSYALPLSGGTMTGRIYTSDWIEYSGYTGLYSPNNGAHFYVNNASYGAWRIAGSRNGWGGLEFDGSTTQVSMMIETNGDTVGWHANSYGWKFRVSGGSAYVYKNYWGGGTGATVLDSSNYSSYALSLGGGTLSGALNIDGGNGNGTYDGTLYVTATNNNDWGLIVNKYNSSATEYGLDVRMGSGASYGIRALFAGAEKFRVADGTVYINGNVTLQASNYSSYALPLSGGTMSGTIYGGSGVYSLFIGGAGGVTRGYLYNDGSGFGFLSNGGSWAYYVPYGTQQGIVYAGLGTGGASPSGFFGNANAVTMYNPSGTMEVRISAASGATILEYDNAAGTDWHVQNSGGVYYITQTSVADRFYINGAAVTIPGSLSKGSGTFDIPHPAVEGKRLRHSFVEGPRVDLIYRGHVTLVNGTATLNMDTDAMSNGGQTMTSGTFEALTRDADIFVQNLTGWEPLKASIQGATLTIVCKDATSTDTVSWMVVAERKDEHLYDPDIHMTDEEGRMILEYDDPKLVTASATAPAVTKIDIFEGL